MPHCVRERVQYRDKAQVQDGVPGAVPGPGEEGLRPHHQVGLVISVERLPGDSRVDDVLSEPALTSNDWLCIVLELVVKLPDR